MEKAKLDDVRAAALKHTDEITKIFDRLKAEITDSNPEDLITNIHECNRLLPWANELMAKTKSIVRVVKGYHAQEYKAHCAKTNEKVVPTIANLLIDAQTDTEQHLGELAARLSATLVHRLDALRSLLSYEKEQMRGANY